MRSLIRASAILAFTLFLSLSYSQTHQFRFAWLSDIHVGASTGTADLGLSVRDINAMHDIAFVILSGDITEMGSDAQLELAKEILDSLKKPYYIVPGNHDTKWSESGCTKFSELWGSDKFVFEYGGIRFIGLHEGPIMKMGDGHFPPEDLRWVDSVLTHHPRRDQPLFFVTHYPLDPGIDNWYQLIERAKRYNTKAVLAGHGHRNRVMNFEGIPGVMGRSNLRAGQATGGYTIANVGLDTVYFSERIPGVETRPAWHSISLERRDYFADTTTYSRPDFTVNNDYPSVKVLWKVNTEYTIASTPALWKDYLVAGNSSGVISCFSLKDGSKRWSFSTGSTVYSSPDAADGRVVLGSSDKNIYCLDIATGKVAWKVEAGAPVVAAARIEDGTVYIGGSDGVFRAIDLKTGRVKWESRTVSGFVEAKPLPYQGKIIFGAWDTYLYALDASDGSLAWKWSSGNPGVLFSPAACWPVASEGKIFIAAPDRYMTAIDAETGKAVWRSNRYQVRETVGVSEDGHRVYARCMTDTVVALLTSSSSLSVLWATPCGYGYDIDPSMPIEKDGVVFFGTKNGLVIALDAKTANVLWKHRVGETIVHTPVPLEARCVLVSDLDGRLSLIQAR